MLVKVDKAMKVLHKTRSALVAEALVRYLQWLEVRALEKRQIEGYRKHPVRPEEFSSWDKEQVWPEV